MRGSRGMSTWTAGALLVALAGGVLLPPPAHAGDGDAIAIVNGRPISKRRLTDVLMDAYGLQVMQQLIVLELAKEQTRKLGISVTEGDVDAEFTRALQLIAPEISRDGKALDQGEKRQALDFLLQQKGISLAEFMIGMERNAHLRKVVERDFRVGDATLREEFARNYGEKVEVRHIQIEVGDRETLHEVLMQLSDGVDFAAVARRHSQNATTAARGGLMEPFAFNAPDELVAPVIREKAFSMAPGEVSTMPIRVARWWHLLKLERRIQPVDAQFEHVRDEVTRSLRERVIPEKMNELVTELFQRAQIRVLDRDLKHKFEKLLEQNEMAMPAARP